MPPRPNAGIVELNEAFAAQGRTVMRKPRIQAERVNPAGGAIAIRPPARVQGIRNHDHPVKPLGAPGCPTVNGARDDHFAMCTPTETVLAFVQAINRHEIGAITSLMTEDHEFVDSLGVTVVGRERMRQAWIAYLFMIPDYAIEVTDVMASGERVVVTGKASGTVAVHRELPPANHWEIPIAARAEVRGGLVARWQVFADNEPVRQILNRT